jgi:replicative DNA helicase
MSSTEYEDLSLQQIENEWLFSACVFSGNEGIAMRDCSWLTPSMFINKGLSSFWKLVVEGESAADAANKAGVFSELLGWLAKCPTTLYMNEYARGVAETHYFRSVLNGVLDVAKAVKERDAQKVETVLRKAQEMRVDSSAGVYTVADMGKDFLDAIDALNGASIKTLLPGVDAVLGGLFPGELSILAGRPGTGKTALALQAARGVARSGKKVLFFSLEMSRVQLFARMACGIVGVSWKDVRANGVNARQRQILANAVATLEKSYGDRFMVQDEVWRVADMRQIATRYMPDLVIVDHLGEIHWHEEGEKESVWYGRAATYLRRHLARQLNCHLMILHQLNRNVESRNDKRPLMSDLRWDGSLEQLADIVLMGYRDDYYADSDQTSLDRVPFELWVRKFRQGTMNSLIMMDYDLKKQWFFDHTPNMPIPQILLKERRDIDGSD